MIRTLRFTILALLLSTLVGCAPDPGEVCDHMMKVMENDPEKPGFLEDRDKCIERMENVKNRHGVNSYRREVECAKTADTSFKMRACMKKEEKRRDGPEI